MIPKKIGMMTSATNGHNTSRAPKAEDSQDVGSAGPAAAQGTGIRSADDARDHDTPRDRPNEVGGNDRDSADEESARVHARRSISTGRRPSLAACRAQTGRVTSPSGVLNSCASRSGLPRNQARRSGSR